MSCDTYLQYVSHDLNDRGGINYGDKYQEYKKNGYCGTQKYFTTSSTNPDSDFSFVWWMTDWNEVGNCDCTFRNTDYICANYFGTTTDKDLWTGSGPGDKCTAGRSRRLCARMPLETVANPSNPYEVQACLAYERPDLIDNGIKNWASPYFCQQPYSTSSEESTNKQNIALYDQNHPCRRVYSQVCSDPNNITEGPGQVCNGAANSYCNISLQTYNASADAKAALGGSCAKAMQGYCNKHPEDLEHCACLISLSSTETVAKPVQAYNICFDSKCASNAGSFHTAYQYDLLNSGLCNTEQICLQIFDFSRNSGQIDINNPAFKVACEKYTGKNPPPPNDGGVTPPAFDFTEFIKQWWIPLLAAGIFLVLFLVFLVILAIRR